MVIVVVTVLFGVLLGALFLIPRQLKSDPSKKSQLNANAKRGVRRESWDALKMMWSRLTLKETAELIAGPKPVDKFGDGVDIVRWVKKTKSELAQWVRTNKHHKPVQDCLHMHCQEAYGEESHAHTHQSSSVRCGIASCHDLAYWGCDGVCKTL